MRRRKKKKKKRKKKKKKKGGGRTHFLDIALQCRSYDCIQNEGHI